MRKMSSGRDLEAEVSPKKPGNAERDRGAFSPPSLFPGLPRFAGKLMPIAEARELHRRVCAAAGGFRLDTLLSEMHVELQVAAADLERIPSKGPLVAVANHPFGVLDGAALGALLSRVRPDVRVMTNSLLEGLSELREHCFFVDPFHTDAS